MIQMLGIISLGILIGFLIVWVWTVCFRAIKKKPLEWQEKTVPASKLIRGRWWVKHNHDSDFVCQHAIWYNGCKICLDKEIIKYERVHSEILEKVHSNYTT